MSTWALFLDLFKEFGDVQLGYKVNKLIFNMKKNNLVSILHFPTLLSVALWAQVIFFILTFVKLLFV